MVQISDTDDGDKVLVPFGSDFSSPPIPVPLTSSVAFVMFGPGASGFK